jgi:transcription antitermination factor NusG
MSSQLNGVMDSDVAQTSAWHVLYTRHQHEKTVNRILESKGFETLLPIYLKVSQWKDRTQIVHLPLFPCYVFFRSSRTEWIEALKTPGVQLIVPAGDGPAVVPESEIESIRRLTENSGTAEPHPYLKTGDRIRVCGGPFAGIEGFLVRKKNLFRLVVCVEILGKAASAEIDAACVERVAAATHQHLPGEKMEAGSLSRHGVTL